MTKRALSKIRASLAARVAAGPLRGSVALGLVLLQLLTALHFALIPHGFSAELRGFEHVHRVVLSRATERTPARPTLVTGTATCAPDACPIGFSGAATVLPAQAASTARIAFTAGSVSIPPQGFALRRTQLLLSAPKTSPPRSG